MKFRSVFCAVAVGVAGVLLPVAAAPAQANEIDVGVLSRVDPSRPVVCATTTGAKVCFQAYGDYWWVRDTVADNSFASVIWGTRSMRSGECQNRLGYGTWAVCNKNYAEGDVIAFSANRTGEHNNEGATVLTNA